MSNKKIGLCIAFKGTNYGMQLQGYATQHILDKYGFNTEIIDYHSGANKGISFSFGALFIAFKHVFNIFRTSFKRQPVLDALHEENMKLRLQAADEFRDSKLHNIRRIDGISLLKKTSKEYYAVLVGSDQIWLPDVAFTNFYTLRFAAPGVRRISYATSLGVSSYPEYAKKAAADFWKKIDYLSVREQQGKELIQSVVDVPVDVVADPTYLLSYDEWLDLIPNDKVVEDHYVLCYFLGDNETIKQYARDFSNIKGLRLVSILSNECNSDDIKYADEVVIGKSPDEFVNLIRHADYVLTDSFHGLAFSIINHKQFLIFYRNRVNVTSRNSRIDNIVRSWGVEDRLVKNPEKRIYPCSDINYESVNERVEDLRCFSKNFLETALEIK